MKDQQSPQPTSFRCNTGVTSAVVLPNARRYGVTWLGVEYLRGNGMCGDADRGRDLSGVESGREIPGAEECWVG